MGVELDCLQELASINVALTEFSSIARVINTEIRAGEFQERFNKLVANTSKCFGVVIANLQILSEIDSEAALIEKFDRFHANYSAAYLKEISKPRIYSDDAYEEYVLLRLLKEAKTGYPLLKRTFERLDKFVDKWIANDAWLAMAIDNLFKRLQMLFKEIAELKLKDTEQAFIIYSGAWEVFNPYFNLILVQHTQLQAENGLFAMPNNALCNIN